MLRPTSTVLSLDIGAARIGVAMATVEARIASPLQTVMHDADVLKTLQMLCDTHKTCALVVGLPRGLDGQHTAQTHAVELFVSELQKHISLPLFWQDEAVTSAQAEAELAARKKPYTKGDIDALAATYILEDFLRDHAAELEHLEHAT